MTTAEEKKWKKEKRNLIGILLVTSIVAFLLFHSVWFSTDNLYERNLKTVENLKLIDNPVLDEIRGKNAQRWIEFHVDSFNSKIKISYFDYSCSLIEEILSLTPGQTISFKIIPNDIYELIKGNNVYIHSLNHNGKELMDLDCRNKLNRKDNVIAIYTFSVGAFLSAFFLIFNTHLKIHRWKIEPSIVVVVLALIFMIAMWKK